MSDGASLAADLANELQRLRNSVADAEQAYRASNLVRATRDDVVELALVRAMGLFEEFIGDLFYMALENRLGGEIMPLVPAGNTDEAILLVAGSDAAGDSRYVSWMPIKEKTLKRASRLLTNGQPFARLANRSAEKAALVDLTTVRNRIAHDSGTARLKFAELAKSKGYPHTRAADYLTSLRGPDPEITLGLARLQSIADGLADPSEAGSRAIFAAEDPYEPAVVAPPGTYECVRSGHKQILPAYGPLGDCTFCPRPIKCPHCGRAETLKSLWSRL